MWIILLLIFANGLFAMSEIAIVTARKPRLRIQAEKGNSRAAAALRLAENPDVFLSTIQIGITLVTILAGLFGGASVSRQIEPWLRELPLIGAYSQGVSQGLVVDSAMSTAFDATSMDMSVSVRPMPTTEEWQYWQPWLHRSVSTMACRVGP